MADTLPPDLRESAQAAHIALTCISTHPTLDMSDYLRGRVDAAAAGLEAALAAVPAQPVSDELIESLWFDAQRAWGEQTSVHPGEHVLFARLLERRIAAAPQAVPVPAAGWKCKAITADFSDQTVTLQMSSPDWYLQAGEYTLIPPAAAPKEHP